MRDLYHNLKVVHMLDAQNITADTTSSSCDLLGYNSALILVNVGADADTLSSSNYWEVELLESDVEGSGYTAVADADQFNPVGSGTSGSFKKWISTSTGDSQDYITGYKGSKRYLKVTIDATGTHSTGCPFAVNAVLGHAGYIPVN